MKIELENGEHFNLDLIFKKPLDNLCYNISNDWDFIILVTGEGLTRTGKTTLAQQIGYYCAKRLGTPFNNNNIVFGGKQLIERAKILPHRSVIINDESREDLSSKRSMEYMNKTLMDFFNECGMYNHLIILVATDFFDFSKNIAVTRSEMLFNVCRQPSQPIKLDDGSEVIRLDRGHVDFYNKKAKRLFYVIGKKYHNDYSVGKKYRSFFGHFTDTWLIDKEQYIKYKTEYLNRERKEETNKVKSPLIYKYIGMFHQEMKKIGGVKEMLEKYKLSYQSYMNFVSENKELLK